MATLKPELKTILERYGINARDTSQVWDCHGTLVLYHKAYEVIAAKESIRFDPPTVIEASSEKKTAVVLVVGHMGDRSEWSFGEAAPANCKNAYPYAMAEKRAKDRVVAKLAGLAAYVYSEDEADEFKDGDRKPAETNGHAAQKPAAKAPENDSPDIADARARYGRVLKQIHAAATPERCDEVVRQEKADIAFIRKIVGEEAALKLMGEAEKRKRDLEGARMQ